ncbi:MAG: hypothetical protein A4E69_00273 [Syntrophus sp. PtaB.Bin138]|nr:MAG: hypothetical protein A4E69_00273 [Syntrophus sp. PtaB.Bin138]
MSMLLKLPDNYASLSDADLLELRLAMEIRIDEITEQFARTKADSTDERYMKTTWYLRAKRARVIYGRDIQRIQLELSRRKGKRRAASPFLGERFIDVARRRLDQEFFSELLAEAKEDCHAV